MAFGYPRFWRTISARCAAHHEVGIRAKEKSLAGTTGCSVEETRTLAAARFRRDLGYSRNDTETMYIMSRWTHKTDYKPLETWKRLTVIAEIMDGDGIACTQCSSVQSSAHFGRDSTKPSAGRAAKRGYGALSL